MRIKYLAQGKNILLPGFEPSTSVSKTDIQANRPICSICRLKAIANELGQYEALVGGTSALAEPGLPRAEERLRLQPPGKAIDNESLKQFPDGARKSNRAITAHSLWVCLFLKKQDNRRCSPGLWAPSRSPVRVLDKQKFFLRVQWKVFD